MQDKLKKIVEILKNKNKTISTMESCTGGALANSITNVEGASEVLHYAAVTYSNEAKEKMGVSKETIAKYSVYSIETARDMSKSISSFSNSNYGIGITGKLNRIDINNLYGSDNLVHISIYDKDNNKFYDYSIEVTKSSREENKNIVIKEIIEKLLEII